LLPSSQAFPSAADAESAAQFLMMMLALMLAEGEHTVCDTLRC
jgi:hypothetical protein